jgi:hypothetical protein
MGSPENHPRLARMRCTICGITVDLLDGTTNQNWVSCFYEGKEEHGPVCADCCLSLLETGEDGEMELKEEYRGKIAYLDGEEEDEDELEYLLMGMILN